MWVKQPENPPRKREQCAGTSRHCEDNLSGQSEGLLSIHRVMMDRGRRYEPFISQSIAVWVSRETSKETRRRAARSHVIRLWGGIGCSLGWLLASTTVYRKVKRSSHKMILDGVRICVNQGFLCRVCFLVKKQI